MSQWIINQSINRSMVHLDRLQWSLSDSWNLPLLHHSYLHVWTKTIIKERGWSSKNFWTILTRYASLTAAGVRINRWSNSSTVATLKCVLNIPYGLERIFNNMWKKFNDTYSELTSKMNGLLRAMPWTSFIVSFMVALKSSVCRFCGSAVRIKPRSVLKLLTSKRSASSITWKFTVNHGGNEEKKSWFMTQKVREWSGNAIPTRNLTRFRLRFEVLLLRWSANRPGVAMMMCGRCVSSAPWSSRPKNSRHVTLKKASEQGWVFLCSLTHSSNHYWHS